VRRAGAALKRGTTVPARLHQLKFGGMADEREPGLSVQPRVRATKKQIISGILDQY
jgi:hypothetical protein